MISDQQSLITRRESNQTGSIFYAPIKGLMWIGETALKSLGNPEIRFSETWTNFDHRFKWTEHHVELLLDSTNKPNFWVEWVEHNENVYLKVRAELYNLYKFKGTIAFLFSRRNNLLVNDFQEKPLKYAMKLGDRVEELNDSLRPVFGRFSQFLQLVSMNEGQLYLQDKYNEIRNDILELESNKQEISWDAWLKRNLELCQSIKSDLDLLKRTKFVFAFDLNELPKPDHFNSSELEELNLLFIRTLLSIRREYFLTYCLEEYEDRYKWLENQLTLLKRDYDEYHSSWANYLMSSWKEKNSFKCLNFLLELEKLTNLYNDYNYLTSENQLKSPDELIDLLKKIFPNSFGQFPDTGSLYQKRRDILVENEISAFRYQRTHPILNEWKSIRHIGVGLINYSKSCFMNAALQLIFSDPKLAELIAKGKGQYEELTSAYQFYQTTQRERNSWPSSLMRVFQSDGKYLETIDFENYLSPKIGNDLLIYTPDLFSNPKQIFYNSKPITENEDKKNELRMKESNSILKELLSHNKSRPIHLAKSVLNLFPVINDGKQHDSIEALEYLLSSLKQKNNPLFYPLTYFTYYEDYKAHKNQLVEKFTDNGAIKRQEIQSVLHIEVPRVKSTEHATILEDILIQSFNETIDTEDRITFSTKDSGVKLKLKPIRREIRFKTPPPFLILNLKRSIFDSATGTYIKNDSQVGIQEEFYLPNQLTLDRKGGKYQLISFNVHQSNYPNPNDPSSGHWIHYRKTDFGYVCINDHEVKPITQIEFLFAAQFSSVCVFSLIDESIEQNEIQAGILENYKKFSITQLKLIAQHAIHGRNNWEVPKSQKINFANLVRFIQLVASRKSYFQVTSDFFDGEDDPNKDLQEAFSKLPEELKKYLWKIWKKADGSTIEKSEFLLRDLRNDLLSMGREDSLSFPPIPSQSQYDPDRYILTVMADQVVKHFEKNLLRIMQDEKEIATVQGTIAAIAQAVRKKMMWVEFSNVTIEEVMHLSIALFSSHYFQNYERFRKQATFSGVNTLVKAWDPLNESKLAQISKQMALSSIQLKYFSNENDRAWTHVLSPAVELLLSKEAGKRISHFIPTSTGKAAVNRIFQLSKFKKDFMLSLALSIISKSPVSLVTWGVSHSLEGVKTLIQGNEPQDLPQSTYNFWKTRVTNVVATDQTIQQLAINRILLAIEHIQNEIKELDTEKELASVKEVSAVSSTNNVMSKPEPPKWKYKCVTNYRIGDIVKKIQVYKFIKDDSGKWITEIYLGDFPTQKLADEMIILDQKRENNLYQELLQLWDLQQQALQLGIEITPIPDLQHPTYFFNKIVGEGKARAYANDQKIFEMAGKYSGNEAIQVIQQKINEDKVHNDQVIAAYGASLGSIKYLVGPGRAVSVIAMKYEDKHVFFVDGNKVGKFSNNTKTNTDIKFKTGKNDAEVIVKLIAHFVSWQYFLETKLFQAQKQLMDLGIPTPEQPKLLTLNYLSKDLQTANSEICSTINQNKTLVGEYISGLKKLYPDLIVPNDPTGQEYQNTYDSIIPEIESEKIPGFWEKLCALPDKGDQWLKNHNISGSANVGVSFPLYPGPKSSSYDGYHSNEPKTYFVHESENESSQSTSAEPQPSTSTSKPKESKQSKSKENNPPSSTSFNPFAPPSTHSSSSTNPSTSSPPSWFGDISSTDRSLLDPPRHMDLVPNFGAQRAMSENPYLWPSGPPHDFQVAPLDFRTLDRSFVQLSTRSGNFNRFQYASMAPDTALSPKQKEAIEKFFANDFIKSVPKGVAMNVKGVFSFMVPDISDFPEDENPRAVWHLVSNNVLAKYDDFVGIENPNSFASRAGVFTGQMLFFGWIGRVMQVARGSTLMVASEGGLYGAIIAEAEGSNKVAGIVLGFAVGAFGKLVSKVPKLLTHPVQNRVFAPAGGKGKLPEMVNSPFIGTANEVLGSELTSVGKTAEIGTRNLNQVFNFTSTTSTKVQQPKVGIYEKNLTHIFRNAPGHLPDTITNQKLLIDTASNSKYYLGKDRFENNWHAKIRKDGSQIWTVSRNGQIRNGGVNQKPREFSSIMGLSKESL